MDTLFDFDQLWDYEKPAATEMNFRELLANAENNPSYTLQLLTQIARAQGLQGKFEEAQRTLSTVDAGMINDPIVKTRYLLEYGRVLNSSGQREKSREYFVQAYETGLAAQADFYTVDAAHMMAIIEPDPDEQLAWNEKALVLAAKSEDARAQKWAGSLYNNLGWTYHERGEYEKALNTFQKALAFRQQHGNERQVQIAQWCVTRGLRSLQRYPEALSILRELEQAASNDGYVDEELAECLLAMGDETAALPYFQQAYAKLSQGDWFAEHETERLHRLKAYADKNSSTIA